MIFGVIVELAVGLLCVVLGLVIWIKRKVSLVHTDHYKSVTKEDLPAYTRLLGIGLMLAAFVIFNAGGLTLSGIKKGYFFWCTLLFLTNGFYGVLMDAQQRSMPDERNEMIMVVFLSLGVISLGYLLFSQKGKIAGAFAMSGKTAAFASLSSLCAAFAVFLLMLLLKSVPSYILLTIINGGVLVFSAALSFVVLREKPTKMTFLGIAVSVLSIVLLSL